MILVRVRGVRLELSHQLYTGLWLTVESELFQHASIYGIIGDRERGRNI